MRLAPSPLHRSRHPLVRALSLVLGLALIAVMLAFGLMIAGVLLVGGGVLLAWRQWKHRGVTRGSARASAQHRPEVLEGEFVVIRRDQPVAH